MIQLADFVAGLLGKFFSYLVRTDKAVVMADRAAFGPLQAENLGKLASLIERESNETEALAHRVLSLSDDRKARIFMQVLD